MNRFMPKRTIRKRIGAGGNDPVRKPDRIGMNRFMPKRTIRRRIGAGREMIRSGNLTGSA